MDKPKDLGRENGDVSDNLPMIGKFLIAKMTVFIFSQRINI